MCVRLCICSVLVGAARKRHWQFVASKRLNMPSMLLRGAGSMICSNVHVRDEVAKPGGPLSLTLYCVLMAATTSILYLMSAKRLCQSQAKIKKTGPQTGT